MTSTPAVGLNVIHKGGVLLDLYVKDQGSKVTLVSFHAAASSKQSTLPIFTGFSLADDTECNLIAISDPALALGDLDLAWYLGSPEMGRFPDLVAPIIQHIATFLETDEMILLGSSGGGFAATNFGRHFPDSTVLAINPRLNLVRRPKSSFQDYLSVVHQAQSRSQAIEASRAMGSVTLKDSFPSGLTFDLCIFQNYQDRDYRKLQTLPFIRRHSDDSRLFLQYTDAGKGHRQMPGWLLRETVRGLKISPEHAGFKPVKPEAGVLPQRIDERHFW